MRLTRDPTTGWGTGGAGTGRRLRPKPARFVAKVLHKPSFSATRYDFLLTTLWGYGIKHLAQR